MRQGVFVCLFVFVFVCVLVCEGGYMYSIILSFSIVSFLSFRVVVVDDDGDSCVYYKSAHVCMRSHIHTNGSISSTHTQ